MDIRTSRYLAAGLTLTLLNAKSVLADDADPAIIISPQDERFDVFERSNSAGGHTFASPVGTVLLSFVSKDRRYCRTARFPADRTAVLACRETGGWKIAAVSKLSQPAASNPTNFGGGYMQEVGEATDARDILVKTAQAYRTSKSYTDTGTVQTVFQKPSREWTQEMYFRTAYVAPFDFLFELSIDRSGNRETRYLIGHDQGGVAAWFGAKPELTKGITSIYQALDAAAGVSRDASGMIPGLIFPGTNLGGDIVRLTDATRLEDAQIDGYDCFQLRGYRWPNTGRPTTVWIEKENFLIRRVYEEQELKDVTTKTTWFYTPAVNVPVAEEALRFVEPAT